MALHSFPAPLHRLSAAALFFSLLFAPVFQTRAQQASSQQPITDLERGRAQIMLSQVDEELTKGYYDPSFHGIDIDKRYKDFQERLKRVPTLGEAYRTVAAFLSGLDDSHTFFDPPQRSYRFDYGYRLEMIGDKCFITQVRPGTDAAEKVHPGDEVLKLGSFTVNRKDSWALDYYLYTLAPQPATDFTLRDPNGSVRMVQVRTKYVTGRRVKGVTADDPDISRMVLRRESEVHLLRNRFVVQDDVMIWKLPIFISDDEQMGWMLGGGLGRTIAQAHKYRALILDLRGNPGGEAIALRFLVSSLFDHDVKIATKVMRKSQKDEIAKSRGHDAFSGKLIVLVDSQSASASELLARVVQLEHRGTIVGDLSSGSVMESMYHPLLQTGDFEIYYGASITMANLLMTDGKSLEKVGVTPDEFVLPTAADLAAGRDPALAKAAELAGIKLDPVAAGKLFPYEWPPD